MRVCGIVLGVAAGLAWMGAGVATQAAEAKGEGRLKIAVVDLDRVRATSASFKKLLGKVEALEDKIVKELESLRATVKTLKGQRAPLSRGTQKYIDLTEQIEELEGKVMLLEIRGKREFADSSLRLLRDYYDLVEASIAEVARREGYDLVLQAGGDDRHIRSVDDFFTAVSSRKVLYAVGKLDITDKVLAEIEKRAAAAEGPGDESAKKPERGE